MMLRLVEDDTAVLRFRMTADVYQNSSEHLNGGRTQRYILFNLFAGAGFTAALGAFLLDECMRKPLFGVVCRTTMAVNVVSDLVDQNIIQIKCANGIKGMVANLERMGAEKHALVPVDSVAPNRTAPRPKLLASAS